MVKLLLETGEDLIDRGKKRWYNTQAFACTIKIWITEEKLSHDIILETCDSPGVYCLKHLYIDDLSCRVRWGWHGLFYSNADVSNADAQSYHSVDRAADIHGERLYHQLSAELAKIVFEHPEYQPDSFPRHDDR